MDEEPAAAGGLTRRQMIRGAVVAGAAAWVAPVIVESLASPAAALTCNAVTFVGVGAQATSATPLSPALPAGQQQGDFLVVVVSMVGDNNDSIGTPTGYVSLGATYRHTTGNARLYLSTFYKFAGASESSPSIAFSGTSATAQMIAYRCVNATTPLDTASTVGDDDATATFVAPSIVTVTSGAMVVSMVANQGASGLGLSGGSYTARISGSSYATATQAAGVAEQLVASPGSVAGATWTGTAAKWVGVTAALRPA